MGQYLDGITYEIIPNWHTKVDSTPSTLSQITITSAKCCLHILTNKNINCSNLKAIVIDYNDESLSQRTVHEIFRNFPASGTQLLLFSDISLELDIGFAEKFIFPRIHLLNIPYSSYTLEGIRQFYVDCMREEWKLDTLKDLYDEFSITQAVIYCKGRKRVVNLESKLKEADYTCSGIYVGQDPAEGIKIMKDFGTGAIRILITSLTQNIPHASLIIFMNPPSRVEDYVNLVGRSGKFGRKACVIHLVSTADMNSLREIEKHYKTNIEEMPANVETYL